MFGDLVQSGVETLHANEFQQRIGGRHWRSSFRVDDRSLTLTVAQGINDESFRDELLAAQPGQAICEYDPFDPEGVQKAERRGVRYYAEGWARLRDDDYLAGDNPGW